MKTTTAPVREIAKILAIVGPKRRVLLTCGHEVWIKYGVKVICTQCIGRRNAASNEPPSTKE